MDPTAALVEIRALAAQLLDREQIDCAEHAQQIGEELAEKVQALDHWLSTGGFAPIEWPPQIVKVR